MNNSPPVFVSKFKYIEFTLASIAVVGTLFKIQHWPFAGYLLTLSLGALTICYFALGRTNPPETENFRMAVFTQRLLFWGYSLTMIGILFKLNRWPNSNAFLIVGSFLIVGITLLNLRMQIKMNLVRVLIVVGIAACLYFSCGHTWLWCR